MVKSVGRRLEILEMLKQYINSHNCEHHNIKSKNKGNFGGLDELLIILMYAKLETKINDITIALTTVLMLQNLICCALYS